MGKFLKLSALGGLVQLTSLVGYVHLSKVEWLAPAKPILQGCFITTMCVVLWVAARQFERRRLTAFCFVQTILGTASLQSLGFLAYPGLAKDMEFFSLNNVEFVSQQLLTLFAAYAGITVCLVLVRCLLTIVLTTKRKNAGIACEDDV